MVKVFIKHIRLIYFYIPISKPESEDIFFLQQYLILGLSGIIIEIFSFIKLVPEIVALLTVLIVLVRQIIYTHRRNIK